MLYVARQARTANRYAPSQARRVTTEAWVFGRYSPSMKLWIDSYRSPLPAGTSASFAPDCSGNNLSITQPTVAKQPLSSVTNDVRGFTFDGVNDCLLTPVISLGGTQGLTLITVSAIFSNSASILLECSTDTAAVTDAIVNSRGDATARNITSFYVGNVGQQYQRGTTNYGSSWTIFNTLANKANPAATEVAIYANNVAPAIGVPITSDNTNTFGNYNWFVGSRNNGAVAPFQGPVSQVLVLNRTVSNDENADLYRSMAQIIGIAWT